MHPAFSNSQGPSLRAPILSRREKILPRLSPPFPRENERARPASFFSRMAATPNEHRAAASCGISPARPRPSRASARYGRFPRDSPPCAVPASHAPRFFRRTARRARAARRRAEIIPLRRLVQRFRKSACPSPPNQILSSQTRDRSASENIAPRLSRKRLPPRRSALSATQQVLLLFSRSPALTARFPKTTRAKILPLPFAPVPACRCPPRRSSSAPPRHASLPANGRYQNARVFAP